MFDGDLATILLTQQDTDDGPLLLAKRVPCDIVGDGKENERVETCLELGALLAREKSVGGGRGSHGELSISLWMPFGLPSGLRRLGGVDE